MKYYIVLCWSPDKSILPTNLKVEDKISQRKLNKIIKEHLSDNLQIMLTSTNGINYVLFDNKRFKQR